MLQVGKNYDLSEYKYPQYKQFKIGSQNLSHMLGSISIEVIIEVLGENSHKGWTMGPLAAPALAKARKMCREDEYGNSYDKTLDLG